MTALPSILDLPGIMTTTKGKPEAGKGAGAEDTGFAGLLDFQAKSLFSKNFEGIVDANIAQSGESAATPVLPEIADQTTATVALNTVTISPGVEPVAAALPIAGTPMPEIDVTIALPDSGKTGKSGKSLPVSLPVAGKAARPGSELNSSVVPDAEPTEETSLTVGTRSEAGQSEAEDTSVSLPTSSAVELAALLAALPAAIAVSESAQIPVAEAAKPANSAPSALAMLQLPEVGNGKSGATKSAAQGDSKPAKQTAAPAVTLNVANAAETSGFGEEAELPQQDGSAPQGKPAAPVAEAKQVSTLPLPANDTVTAVSPADALPPHHAPIASHAAAPQAAEARPDLTQIVERLAAAREAMAPATGEISFEHREFGELSLRVDQNPEGRLQVALSARDAEAHRAVAAAMAADRGQFSGSDQQQASTPQQQSMGSQQRSAMSERETTGGGQSNHSARQEQSGGQAAARQPSHSNSDSATHSGIFA